MEAFSSISPVAKIYDSPSGIDGLPPHVQAYIEASQRPYQLAEMSVFGFYLMVRG